MSASLLQHYSRGRQFDDFFSTYWNACRLFHQQDKLEQLVAWAKRKRLARVKTAYCQLLIQCDDQLWKYRRRAPLAVRLASCAVALNHLVNPPRHQERRR